MEALPEAAAQGFTDLLDDVYHRGQAHHATDTPITLQAGPDVAPEHLFLEFVYQPIRDAEGHVVGIFVEGIDVTERIAAARRLRETEDRYRALAENVDVGMCVIEMKFDADGKAVDYRIVDGNPAYERHTGLYGSVGKWVSEIAPGLERHWFDMYGNVALTGEPARFELGAAGLGNRMFEVEAHRVGDPDRHHVAILFTDVTDRRHAEEELRENVAFMRSVLASSNDCIMVLDLDANLVFMSEGGQQVMEVSDFNAIAGCPWPNFWDGEGHLAAKEAIASARAGMPATFQGYADTMKGRRLYWDVQVSPIFGPDGRPERILSVSRDISALKASEEARAVLNQELSHRMKNLLAMVQAITAQAMRQARTMKEANEAVFTRISALARAQDILTRSNFEEADVGEVIGAAIGPHQTTDHRIGADGPRVGLTAQQALGLSLAIHELATNAAKYGALSNETGRVVISWGQINGAFKFEWIESGGPSVTLPTHRGFGSKLIERIVASYFEGEGCIDFDPAGIRFTLTGAPARPERIA